MSLIYMYCLLVMHVTQTNGNALELGDWRRQEGYPLLIARSTTKVLLEVPYKPQRIGGNRGEIEKKFILPTKFI